MDLRQLRYFVTVATTENIAQASERLHISASPLSRQIIRLEEALGVALFERERKRLKLTEAVALEKTPDHYLNVVAVKTEDKDKPWARDIVAAFRTPEYRAALDKHFAGYARPAYLQ